MKNSKIIIFTIVANDHIPHFQLFSRYLKKQHPEITLYCITLENAIIQSSQATCIPLRTIDTISDLDMMTFKYNPLELSTAVKPFIFSWLFRNTDAENILYFDADILIYKPITKIFTLLKTYEVVLTPHIRKPITDDKLPNEISFAQSGYYNAGFVGLRRSNNTISFLIWWQNKTQKYCYIDFARFLFVDQRWLDYAPIFLNAYIIKDPGYNVSYFNLQEYINTEDIHKIVFLHFSGYDKEKISVYQNRFDRTSLGDDISIYDNYYTELNALKPSKSKQYSYDYFRNGVYISPWIKKIFYEPKVAIYYQLHGLKPFSVKGKNTVYTFLNTRHKSVPATYLAHCLYLTDSEIQLRFPGLDFSRVQPNIFHYLLWFIQNGITLYKLDKQFIKAQKDLLEHIKNVVYLNHSFVISNRFKRFILRIIYYIRIISIDNVIQFTDNVYLFFLQRYPEVQTVQHMQSLSNHAVQSKRQLIDTIIHSPEYLRILSPKQHTQSKMKIALTKTIYRVIALIFIH